jgi:hypothetical protein
MNFTLCQQRIHQIRGVMVWLSDAYAPFILKCILNIFLNIKKFKRKFHVYIFRCYIDATCAQIFSMKNRLINLDRVQKINFGAKNMLFVRHVLSFTPTTKNITLTSP